MIVNNTLRTFLLSNLVLAGVVLSSFPATAAKINANSVSQQSSNSGLLVAQVNTELVREADKHIESGLNSMNAAAEAESGSHAIKSFTTALNSFEKASQTLKKAGMHDSGSKMDKCIQALSRAIDTESKEEGDKLVETAVKYLQEIAVDIEKVLS